VTLANHDTLNRLLTHQPGGVLTFKGTLNEPGAVTIGGKPAQVDATNRFTAGVPVTAGTNTITINAVDPSGNAAEAVYEVDQTGAPKTFTYDANGNMTSDGMRTFEWDARNQLVAVNVETHRSEFAYDGLQRRVREIEKENGVSQADTRVLWCETAICEERAADGASVTRRVFDRGEIVSGEAHISTTDHLGSVRELTDSTGTLQARYDFDPWGRRGIVAGGEVTQLGFTSLRALGTGALWLAVYRAYDSQTGRWLSEDPLRLQAGPNLGSYVSNNPIGSLDPMPLGNRVSSNSPCTIYTCT
jgi:RHS repeat-associated protein